MGLMNWQITQEDTISWVRLESAMSIRDAVDFHQAVLPLVKSGNSVRLDAGLAGCIHTSIMQILYALSKEAPDFGVTNASEDFRASEARFGLSFNRSEPPVSLITSEPPAVPIQSELRPRKLPGAKKRRSSKRRGLA